MILLIDNYDSFTYNLVHYFECLGQFVLVYKHDEITIEAIDTLNPSHLVISPGPKAPESAGISLAAIAHCYQTIPILGVCLGHQCLAQFFGARIIKAKHIMHGKVDTLKHTEAGLFKALPRSFNITRYHSLMIDPKSLPNAFRIDAWTSDAIMAISHRHYPLYGLQFHPEAYLTEHGMEILAAFVQQRGQNNHALAAHTRQLSAPAVLSD